MDQLIVAGVRLECLRRRLLGARDVAQGTIGEGETPPRLMVPGIELERALVQRQRRVGALCTKQRYGARAKLRCRLPLATDRPS